VLSLASACACVCARDGSPLCPPIWAHLQRLSARLQAAWSEWNHEADNQDETQALEESRRKDRQGKDINNGMKINTGRCPHHPYHTVAPSPVGVRSDVASLRMQASAANTHTRGEHGAFPAEARHAPDARQGNGGCGKGASNAANGARAGKEEQPTVEDGGTSEAPGGAADAPPTAGAGPSEGGAAGGGGATSRGDGGGTHRGGSTTQRKLAGSSGSKKPKPEAVALDVAGKAKGKGKAGPLSQRNTPAPPSQRGRPPQPPVHRGAEATEGSSSRAATDSADARTGASPQQLLQCAEASDPLPLIDEEAAQEGEQG
jgi:hypothetical protein